MAKKKNINLNEFTEGPYSLSDFQEDAVSTPVDERSRLHLAGRSAYLNSDFTDPRSINDKFNQVSQYLAMDDNSLILDLKRKQVEESMKGNHAVMIPAIADLTIPEDKKRAMVDEVTNPSSFLYGESNLIATKALASNPFTGNEEDEKRIDTVASVVRVINDQEELAQSILNKEAASADPSFADMVGDALETAVPFASGNNVAKILVEAKGLEGAEKTKAYAKALTLIGESRKDMADFVNSIPFDKRVPAIQELANIIKSNSSVLISDTNKLTLLDNLSVGLTGDYSNTERFFDDFTSLLDVAGLASPLAKLKSVVKGEKAASAIAAAKRVKGGAAPVSLTDKLKEVNPTQAKAAFHIAAESEGDQAAQAIAGTSKVELVGEKMTPSPLNPDGVIINEVHDIGSVADEVNGPQMGTMDYINRDTRAFYSDAEKQRASAKVTNDFENAAGVRLINEMSQIGFDEGTQKIGIKAVYAKPEGAWSNADEAVEQTLVSLRNYGVERSDIKVGVMNGKVFVPSDQIEKAVANGEFKNGLSPRYVTYVDYSHNIGNRDIEQWDSFDMMYNFFDRFKFFAGSKRGSLTRNFLDPASIFQPEVAGAAAKADDRTARITELLTTKGNEWSGEVGKLNKYQQQAVFDYIKEANYRGIPFDVDDLVSRGFGEQEIKVVRDFRQIADEHFYLNNSELKKRLHDRGYGVYENKSTKDFLVGREVKLGSVPEGSYVIGPDGEVVSFSKFDKEVMEQEGWSVVKLKEAVDEVEYAVASNKAGQSVYRVFNDSDKVLHYRDGYYPVAYNAPIFIETTLKNADGSTYTKAVGLAGSRKEAQELVKNTLTKQFKKKPEDFKIRWARERQADRADYLEDIVENYGLSAQRRRGERLMAATGQPQLGDSMYVMNPVEALSHSIATISRRVGYGDYLSAMEEKFMKNYSDVLRNPSHFPRTQDDIGSNVVGTGAKVRDARTSFEYLAFLRKGYYNDIDVATQKVLETLADVSGEKKLYSLEKFLARNADKSPTLATRRLAFMASIVSAPTRQAIVQASQGLMLSAIDPVYVFSGNGLRQAKAFTLFKIAGYEQSKVLSKIAGMSEFEFKQAMKDLDDSGLLANISRHNIVAGSLEGLSKLQSPSALQRGLKEAVGLPQKWGFDYGESINMASAFLTFRRQALKTKKVLTQKDLQEIATQARNFTGTMNRAGDMPYNNNLLSVAFQFFQFPHKMTLLMSTNRQIDAATKVKLLAAHSVLWGVPFSTVPTVFASLMPEDKEARESVENGLMNVILNKMFSYISGEQTGVKFKDSMAPLQLDYMMELASGNKNAPAAFLVKKAYDATEFARMHKYDNLDDFLTVGLEFSKISSGVSQAMKAKYAWEVGQLVDKYGDLTDDQVSKVEAIAQSMGFHSMDEARHYSIMNRIYSDRFGKDNTPESNDIKEWYKTIKRVLLADGVDHRDTKRNMVILSEFQRAFGQDPVAFRELRSLMQRDIQKGDLKMFTFLMGQAGIASDQAVIQSIRENDRLTPEEKKALLDNIDRLKALREDKDGFYH